VKSLLFINPGPFGSLTDTFYYCKILKDKYDITYLGFDESKPMVEMNGIRIIHLPGSGKKLRQKLLFVKKIREITRDYEFNFILIYYYIGCSIIRLFLKNNLVVDIRTSYISKNLFRRILSNSIMSLEVRFFEYKSVISESLARYLWLGSKLHILPLGAPSFPLIKKDFNSLNILYVGTFHQRNIVNTILGFTRFMSRHNNQLTAKYTIIGFGTDVETQEIKDAIASSGISDSISYDGIIRYPELIKYLEINNVGISYIPLRKYFDNQPPTKTFEYLLSGMAVLATDTSENRKIINDSNGIIIGESVDDICFGLEHIYLNRVKYISEYIQNDSCKYSWDNIVNFNLVPYIESLQ